MLYRNDAILFKPLAKVRVIKHPLDQWEVYISLESFAYRESIRLSEKMRSEGGYSEIMKCISNMEKHHSTHMKNYGDDNHLRMSGIHETAKYKEFKRDI